MILLLSLSLALALSLSLSLLLSLCLFLSLTHTHTHVVDSVVHLLTSGTNFITRHASIQRTIVEVVEKEHKLEVEIAKYDEDFDEELKHDKDSKL